VTQHGFHAGQSRARRASDDADVIVVGAGPGGSSAAYHLARAGLDVLLLEKSTFPREKVCGDGLTPRAVKQLVGMGITPEPADGWFPNKGIRIIGGGARIELDWPELSSYPGFGLVRTRRGFDEIVARAAQQAGARLAEGVTVTGPALAEETGRITGVIVRDTAAAGRARGGAATGDGVVTSDGAATGDRVAAGDGAAGGERTYRARLVVAADGNSSRLSLAMGLRKRDDRPLGVAIRTYYTSPRHDDDYLETWLELRDGSALLPGYGWIFGVGDGTSNVGLGLLNTSASFAHADYRAMLRNWLATMPAEWGFTEETRIAPVRGAALPMGFNRTPHYTRGLLLVGDAGGMVNPFNGEGISTAMESGEIAAQVIIQALARPDQSSTELALQGYPQALKDAYGGYYTLGRKFVGAIGHPWFMQFATRHGLPRPTLMRFTMKLLANLTEPRGGDAADRVINALSKITPAA
jgi:flavin-dependent dehydrogenase